LWPCAHGALNIIEREERIHTQKEEEDNKKEENKRSSTQREAKVG
jgi:hypothetical protein